MTELTPFTDAEKGDKSLISAVQSDDKLKGESPSNYGKIRCRRMRMKMRMIIIIKGSTLCKHLISELCVFQTFLSTVSRCKEMIKVSINK